MARQEVVIGSSIIDFAEVSGPHVRVIAKTRQLGGQNLDPNLHQVGRMTERFDSLIGYTPNK